MLERRRKEWVMRWLAWPELVVMLILISVLLVLWLPYVIRR